MLRVRADIWEDLVSDQHFVGFKTFAKCTRCGFCTSAFGRGPEARAKSIERLQKSCLRRETNTYFSVSGWKFYHREPY